MFALKSNFFVPDSSILHAGMFVICGTYIAQVKTARLMLSQNSKGWSM